MFKNLEKKHGRIEFKALLVVAPPTYNIVDELKRMAIGVYYKIRRF